MGSFIRATSSRRARTRKPDPHPPRDDHVLAFGQSLRRARRLMSFLAAAMTEISADLAASMWNLNFFDDNNGVPDGAIMLSPDATSIRKWSACMELRTSSAARSAGSRSAIGRSQVAGVRALTEGHGVWAGREFVREGHRRTLGFPDGYWSDLANRANAEQARRTMISAAPCGRCSSGSPRT
jgi:hypothetical protein